jgi:hypothetical protein
LKLTSARATETLLMLMAIDSDACCWNKFQYIAGSLSASGAEWRSVSTGPYLGLKLPFRARYYTFGKLCLRFEACVDWKMWRPMSKYDPENGESLLPSSFRLCLLIILWIAAWLL